jgi:methyl-accepting chemotaxis protein
MRLWKRPAPGRLEMEAVTEASAATAEESAAAAQELTAQTETVKSVAGKLTAMVGAA